MPSCCVGALLGAVCAVPLSHLGKCQFHLANDPSLPDPQVPQQFWDHPQEAPLQGGHQVPSHSSVPLKQSWSPNGQW
ncbi:hypothetical protein B0H13DRAFT_2097415 [Mycena leptocephala]|nr:hypothetical protein B0H13DRAFT_2097415 [Mycena leptocephala]